MINTIKKLKLREINHAFLHLHPVEVWFQGELIGEGTIQRHTRMDVVIKGMHYLKQNCEFRIKS